jgi:hypothetical protein
MMHAGGRHAVAAAGLCSACGLVGAVITCSSAGCASVWGDSRRLCAACDVVAHPCAHEHERILHVAATDARRAGLDARAPLVPGADDQPVPAAAAAGDSGGQGLNAGSADASASNGNARDNPTGANEGPCGGATAGGSGAEVPKGTSLGGGGGATVGDESVPNGEPRSGMAHAVKLHPNTYVYVTPAGGFERRTGE